MMVVTLRVASVSQRSCRFSPYYTTIRTRNLLVKTPLLGINMAVRAKDKTVETIKKPATIQEVGDAIAKANTYYPCHMPPREMSEAETEAVDLALKTCREALPVIELLERLAIEGTVKEAHEIVAPCNSPTGEARLGHTITFQNGYMIMLKIRWPVGVKPPFSGGLTTFSYPIMTVYNANPELRKQDTGEGTNHGEYRKRTWVGAADFIDEVAHRSPAPGSIIKRLIPPITQEDIKAVLDSFTYIRSPK